MNTSTSSRYRPLQLLLLGALLFLVAACGSDGESAETGEDGEGDAAAEAPSDVDVAPVPAELVDRLAVALAASGDEEFVVSEEQGRCAADRLQGRLAEPGFESLTVRVEENESIEPEDELGPDEIATISNGFADCLDFSFLLDEFSRDLDNGYDTMLACVENQIGLDGLEAAMLYSVLADQLPFGDSQLFTVGLDACPDQTRGYLASIFATSADLDADSGLVDCLSEIPVEEYQQLLADDGLQTPAMIEEVLGQSCSFDSDG